MEFPVALALPERDYDEKTDCRSDSRAKTIEKARNFG